MGYTEKVRFLIPYLKYGMWKILNSERVRFDFVLNRCGMYRLLKRYVLIPYVRYKISTNVYNAEKVLFDSTYKACNWCRSVKYQKVLLLYKICNFILLIISI